MATLTEQILRGSAGETVLAPVSLIVTDDWTTTQVIVPLGALQNVSPANVKTVLVYDHAYDPEQYDGKERENVIRNVHTAEEFASERNVEIVRGKGIQHHVLPELGYIKPGTVVVGNDSHTCTLGAYSVYAKAMQPTAVATAMQTGKVPITIPETIGVEVTGRLRPGVSLRDAMLHLLRLLGNRATGKVLEYYGEGLELLDLVESTILTNMSSEAVAATAIFPLTDRVRQYLESVGITTFPTLEQDTSAYVETVHLNLDEVVPVIARNGNPRDVVPVSEEEGRQVDQVFVGTCSGGKYSDIREFWKVVRGRKVKIRTLLFPSTKAVMERCRKERVLEDLENAGVHVMETGCGPCFGFGQGRMQEGEATVSTGNRNYIGRMGPKSSSVFLASGYTAGMTALRGRITSFAAYDTTFTDTPQASDGRVVTPRNGNVWQFPSEISTDDIAPSNVPGVGTTSDRATFRELAFYFRNPAFRERVRQGDVIVAGENFGKGSNRAASVLALKDSGIAAVIARSFAPLYAEGALFEGLPTVTITDDAFYDGLTEETRIEIDWEGHCVRADDRTYEFTPQTALANEMRKEGAISFLNRNGGWGNESRILTLDHQKG